MSPSPRLHLPGGAVHLWWLRADEVDDPRLLADWRSLLTQDERARVDSFVFPAGRREGLATRALVRAVLSRYAPVAPADWRFQSSPHGRPAIAGPLLPETVDLHFNLAHSSGVIVCLVCREPGTGVDVEDCRRQVDTRSLADSYFAPREAAALRALPEAARRQRFFTLWTLKEAYLKARGLGLSLPLTSAVFDLGEDPADGLADPGGQRAAFAGGGLEADPGAWQFIRLTLAPHYLAAIAIHKGAGPPFTLEVRATVPLRD